MKIDDKTLHVWAGTVVTVTAGLIMHFTIGGFLYPILIGLFCGILAGAFKEVVYDKLFKLGVPTWRDFWNTVWGAGVGTILLMMIIGIIIS